MRETREARDTASVPGTEHESQARVDKARQAELDAQAERDELLWVMSDAKGRRFMWRRLADAGIYRTTFTGDALTSAFKEGERNAGIRLMTLILQHCPERLSQMQKEARTNERRKES
jgi:hypothetical protein